MISYVVFVMGFPDFLIFCDFGAGRRWLHVCPTNVLERWQPCLQCSHLGLFRLQVMATYYFQVVNRFNQLETRFSSRSFVRREGSESRTVLDEYV